MNRNTFSNSNFHDLPGLALKKYQIKFLPFISIENKLSIQAAFLWPLLLSIAFEKASNKTRGEEEWK
jgi:hypothetical protein